MRHTGRAGRAELSDDGPAVPGCPRDRLVDVAGGRQVADDDEGAGGSGGDLSLDADARLARGREQRCVGDERVAQRDVEVDGAGVVGEVAAGGDDGPGDRRAPHGVGIGAGIDTDVAGPPGDRAEDPRLAGRLVGARAAQLHGPVGREQQQRHPGVMGLERGRMEVRDRGPGRRHDRDGTPRPFREAEGEERGGTLVDPDVQAQQPRLVSGGQGVRQRRRA